MYLFFEIKTYKALGWFGSGYWAAVEMNNFHGSDMFASSLLFEDFRAF